MAFREKFLLLTVTEQIDAHRKRGILQQIYGKELEVGMSHDLLSGGTVRIES